MKIFPWYAAQHSVGRQRPVDWSSISGVWCNPEIYAMRGRLYNIVKKAKQGFTIVLNDLNAWQNNELRQPEAAVTASER